MNKTMAWVFGAFLLSYASLASAIPYENIIDFSGSGTYLGQSFSLMTDSNSSGFFGLYTHTVDFNPAAVSVDSGSLTINYAFANERLGSGAAKEIYFISENGTSNQLGMLTGADDALWHSVTFDLTSYLGDVSGTLWSIGFKFTETTNGTDTFYLDKSTLFGEYTPLPNVSGEVLPETVAVVPEPSTFILLGAGLAGLVTLGLRRRNNG